MRLSPKVPCGAVRQPVAVCSNAHRTSVQTRAQQRTEGKGGGYDLVLSSGFLAFAHHAGFLQAVDDVGLPVNGIMGTSAGAIIGSLYAAGYSPREILREVTKSLPIDRLVPHSRPWEGVWSLAPLVTELQALLPARFDELQRDFACAVVGSDGSHVLLDQGSLPAAVTASAAIPVVFCPVPVPERLEGPFIDGGIKCRIGMELWRQHRYKGNQQAAAPAVVHLIGRSSPFSGNDSTSGLESQNAVVVKCPKSGVSFWSYGDYHGAFEAARQRALPILERLVEDGAPSSGSPFGLGDRSRTARDGRLAAAA